MLKFWTKSPEEMLGTRRFMGNIMMRLSYFVRKKISSELKY